MIQLAKLGILADVQGIEEAIGAVEELAAAAMRAEAALAKVGLRLAMFADDGKVETVSFHPLSIGGRVKQKRVRA